MEWLNLRKLVVGTVLGGLMISVGGCYYPYRYWRDHDYYHRDGRYDGRYYGDRGYYHCDYDRDRW